MALSLYLEVFMKSLSDQLGLKFYFYMVLFLGGITPATKPSPKSSKSFGALAASTLSGLACVTVRQVPQKVR